MARERRFRKVLPLVMAKRTGSDVMSQSHLLAPTRQATFCSNIDVGAMERTEGRMV